MRLLLIHSDRITYDAKKQTPFAEKGAALQDSLDEALVAFCAVEAVDEQDPNGIVNQAQKEIRETAKTLGVTRIMLYPYAHLSSNLANPSIAVTVLKDMEKTLQDEGYTVKRAPFGWYKAFTLSCKGHPLAELSKTILPEEGIKIEGKRDVTHEWFVLTPAGEKKDVTEYMDDSPFGCLVKKELGIPVQSTSEPLHVQLMRSKELVNYEPRSDVGHLRWLPRGKLIRDLLADYVLMNVLSYGGYPVETPIMYDLNDKAINEHAAKFGERQYRFMSGTRDMMLRFAACFGMFSIMHDMHISPNNLPLKMYELSTYSFRHEQKGEVIGLKRLRAFTMPDMHTLCSDMAEAMGCFEEQLRMGWQSGKDLETTLVGVFRCTKDFYEKYGDWVQKVASMSGVPLLIEILGERVHYWVAKIDLAAIDGQGRPIENPTVQIDVESSSRFDISYIKGNEKIYPPILHFSPTGSIERVICAMLEETAHHTIPMFPNWLSPTQVRIIPIAERHNSYAEKVWNQLTANCIRTDIDDREESMNKKIRHSGMDWVPYTVVIGDHEVEKQILTVTIRKYSSVKTLFKQEMTIDNLSHMVKEELKGMPFRPLYTPSKLSNKAQYI